MDVEQVVTQSDETVPRAGAWRVASAAIACVIGVALLVHLATLLVLRPIVASQELPKDSDQYSGVVRSAEVVVYGQLAGAGLVLLLPLAALLVFLGVRAIRRRGPAWEQIIGVYSILIAVLALFATPWAGFLVAGYGW